MKTIDIHRKHVEAMVAKKERLEGLRALFATHEQFGEHPVPRNYMWNLRVKIRSVENQLREMADSDQFFR
jgi:hypothetical protein